MLEGVRVLDFSHLLPGQLTSALLAQLGADVVMVEKPGGNRARSYRSSFAMYNHSKRNIALDLTTDRGTELALELARESDVVIEQFRPGVVTRLGVDYDAVADVNPDIVYCSISGFGQDGPRAEHVAHDVNVTALTGTLDLTGEADGKPVIPGTPMVDVATALTAALSIVASLHDGGEFIDLAMLDVAATLAMPNLAEYFGREHSFTRGETLLSGGYPCYAIYACRDGTYLSVAATESHFWEELCEGLGFPEYVDDQWADGKRRAEIFDAFRSRFAELSLEEWQSAFDPTDIPVAPVTPIHRVPEIDQVRHRNLIEELSAEDGGEGERTVTYPARFASHSVEHAAPPRLGEDSRELLAHLGCDPSEIEQLLDDGVVTTT